MAKRQNFIVGSTNVVTESLTDAQLDAAFDRYEILTADKLDGVFNAVSDYSNDSSNEIANAIQSITGSQPSGSSQTELANALQQMRSEIETTSLTFKGYVATSAPSSSTYALVKGNIWINSATMPTSFPIAASSIKEWNGSSWVNYGSTYTPKDFDFFRNINDNEGYYWFGGLWTVMSTDMSTTYFTLNQSTGKWEISSTYDNTLVHRTGNETIAGTKTFSNKITGSISGNCDGNAGTVTNGVYTTGNQTIGGTKTFSSTIQGSISGSSTSCTGNAATVTNGVYTTGNQTIGGTKTFSNKITGSISGNCDGNAGTVTNGVYTTGNQTIAGTKTFSSTISGSINGNAATVTNGVYTTGNQTISGNKTFSGAVALNGTVSGGNSAKKTINGWGMPDYSAGVSVAWNTDVSITANGYVVYEFSGGGGGGTLTISINSVNVCLINADYGNKHSGVVPVANGSTFKATGSNVGTHNFTFYPCLGG